MEKNLKELLLKDLCARLPYGVKIKFNDSTDDIYNLDGNIHGRFTESLIQAIEDLELKPYLRQMSSMTEEERKEFSKLLVKRYCEEDWEGHISTSYCIEIDEVYTDDEDGIKYPSAFSMDAIDWLNEHHFDYRGLIEKGLALEAPESMYNK